MKTAKKNGRPVSGQMPMRQFRMSDADWLDVVAAAGRCKLTVSAWIRLSLAIAAAGIVDGQARPQKIERNPAE